MTALTQYERLETPGLWRESAEHQRRNVIVSFGNASLVLTDQAGQPLTHWSLAAIVRNNPGTRPAIFSPGEHTDEELEIDEDVMIDAIGKVLRAIDKSRPHHGRLRLLLTGGITLLVLAIVFVWLPGALRQHSLRVLPETVRQDIGGRMVTLLSAMSGSPCNDAAGRAALTRLSRAVLQDQSGRVLVVPAGVNASASFPGGITLLNRSVVEDHEEASVVAGYLLREAQRRAEADPLTDLLTFIGPLANIRLLTTGHLPDDKIKEYLEQSLTQPPSEVDVEALLARFEAVNLSSTPFAFALDPSGETTLELIEADPMRTTQQRAILTDEDWIRLQGICGS